MGYTSSTKVWGTDQLLWNALHLSDSALVLNDGNTLPITMMVGGQYNAAGVTFDDGDAAVLQLDSAGYLLCSLKSAITVGGDLAVDVWSYRDTAGTDADAWVYTHDEDLSGVAEVWQGIGGYDETADRFRAYPISTDHAAEPATPQISPIGGEYRLAADTYDDGDSVIAHFDVNGNLQASVENLAYVDDSAFTVGTDEVMAVGLLADEAGTDSVDEGDIGIARMTLNRQAVVTPRLTDGTEYDFNAGAVSAATQRVTLASDDPAVVALQILDDWDETNRAAVNLISGQAGVAAGSGVNGVTVQRVTVATDDTVATDLTAIKTAVEIMDDWDETNRAAVNTISGQIGVAAGAGAVDALTQRTTLASDDPAVTALQIMDDWDESDRAKVNPIAGQAGVAAGAGAVDALTQRSTLASDDPAVVALQIIDDWDAVHDSAVGTDGPQVMLEAANFDGAALPNAVAEGDAVRPKASLQGVAYVNVVSEDGSFQPAYDSGSDSFKHFEINPISEHHAEETLIDVTNETDGTNNYYFDMDGYKSFALQLELSGGSGTMTVTIEASIQDDGTAAASCTYQDVTNDWFGSASFTASDFLERTAAVNVKYVKVKTVSSTGGSNDADATVYLKRAY